MTIAGKPLREIHEVSNHKEILRKLYQFVDNKQDISEQLISDIHNLVLRNIDDENAGRYRKITVGISGDDFVPTDPSNISQELQKLLSWYRDSKHSLHSVELACQFHYRFVKIHPFIDGNGRTVRVLINLILMQVGYPMIIIPVVRRAEYIQSLHSTAGYPDFQQFFYSVVEENLKDYLRMIEG
ncbi:MAG: Fic family protein [Patescibacteria group bacterium]|nr:Fic family protein [Patescibacteria group bacterium]